MPRTNYPVQYDPHTFESWDRYVANLRKHADECTDCVIVADSFVALCREGRSVSGVAFFDETEERWAR